jgi:ADP-ribose pyrophosphatase
MSEPGLLFEGRRFRVERVLEVTSDGVPRVREVVRHPGAVVVLPLLDEDPAAAARRELAEETGYQAGRIDLLTTFYSSPGILDERMYLYLATSLREGQPAPEPGEDVRPLLASWQEALRMARDGRIQDAKSLAGLLYYEAFGGAEES